MKTINEKYTDLRTKTMLREMVARVRSGFEAFGHNPICWTLTVVYWLLVLLLPRIFAPMMGLGSLGTKLLSAGFWMALPIFLALYLFLVSVSAAPKCAWAITDAFLRIGLTNRAGEVPFVVSTSTKQIVVQANGIPLTEFKDCQDKLESALNCRIVRFKEGKDKRHIILSIAPGDAKLPTKVPMTKDNLPLGKAVLSLGVALDGPVLVDLTKMPHMLIGGSTGSGKTFLVLSLIKQALDKAMQVYILDMKGGVDYPRSWKGTRCSYNDSRETILSVLSQLVDTLEDRKLAFGYLEQEIGKSCPNIDTYNRLNPEHAFSRIMVVCDELAEVTDTTGMDKPNKELVNAIVGKLGTLARLGRAFGIHLVMALQRPDASALPGQIKNNADVRACGRADNVLSTIIMDNGDAADLPKDIPGRFITNLDGGTIFQGYMLPDLDDEDFDVNDTGGHDDGSEKD